MTNNLEWKPGDNFCVRLKDKTGDPRTWALTNEMVHRMREIAEEYGFDLDGSGSQQSMIEVFKGEQAIMEKYKENKNGK